MAVRHANRGDRSWSWNSAATQHGLSNWPKVTVTLGTKGAIFPGFFFHTVHRDLLSRRKGESDGIR